MTRILGCGFCCLFVALHALAQPPPGPSSHHFMPSHTVAQDLSPRLLASFCKLGTVGVFFGSKKISGRNANYRNSKHINIIQYLLTINIIIICYNICQDAERKMNRHRCHGLSLDFLGSQAIADESDECWPKFCGLSSYGPMILNGFAMFCSTVLPDGCGSCQNKWCENALYQVASFRFCL